MMVKNWLILYFSKLENISSCKNFALKVCNKARNFRKRTAKFQYSLSLYLQWKTYMSASDNSASQDFWTNFYLFFAKFRQKKIAKYGLTQQARKFLAW